ncbi:GNAT family N-acetyltransferase [Candidatus Parcubacteria bacterium]|nr:GNAT family N-acetyltransferase [Candidatus Parcubacteria bacterium]
MKIKIKFATIENLKDIQKLNLMLFKKEYYEYDKTLNCEWTFKSDGENYFKKRIIKDDGCVLIAYADNKIVGYLIGGLKEIKPSRLLSAFAELENMFVLENYRCKQIGSKLFKAFINWCKSKNVKRLRVVASAMNICAIKFYKKNGFIEYDLILESDI